MSSAAEPGIDLDTNSVVWRATIVHPRRRGALTGPMYDVLESMAVRAQQAPGLRAVVITGTPGTFSAGTDVRGFADFSDAGVEGLAYERRLEEVFTAIDAIPVPVLAAVDGPAMGGGLALLSCCDVIIASERARFGAPVARTLGNCLPSLVMARLGRFVGPARVRSIMLLAEQWSAAEAAAAGLVHTVVPADELAAATESAVAQIGVGAPLTLRSIKELDRRLAAGRYDDEDVLRRCYGSADFREGLAAFADKREPVWRGR